MDSFLTGFDWKALGVGGLMTGYSIYVAYLARADSKEDKAYARSQNELVYTVLNRLIVVVEQVEKKLSEGDSGK